MRFLFKTDYDQDIRLFKHNGQRFWYGLLALLLLGLPVLLPEGLRDYMLGQMVFVFIYSVAGLALMLLIGFTGQISLGHAAFMAVGAYTEAVLQAKGVPFVVSLPCAALFAGIAGVIVGLPALRLKGIYLGIATLSFGYIAEEIATRWDSVTGGNAGKHLKPVDLFGYPVDDDIKLYYLTLAILVIAMLAIINLMRSPTGRAFVAIRDSEISAQSMGIHGQVQDHELRAVGRAHRRGRRALRAQAHVHHPRAIHPAGLDRAGHAGVHRRPGFVSRRGVRRGVHHLAAAIDHGGQGLSARRRRCADRLAADHLWPDPDRLPAVRADGHLRPLAEDTRLPGTVPLLPQGHVPATEDVHEVGQAQMSFFACENLSIQFGGVKAVTNVSFAVEQGEVFTIIGPNGAGKTTIFNLISLIYPPTAGRILFEGAEITGSSPHKVANLGIARTFQNIELFEHATVLQNLLIGRHNFRRTNVLQEMLFLPAVRRAELAHREAVEKVIDFLDLQRYRESLVAGLPYGVRKVVEMARALCTGPKLLLLDEPSSGLNPEETDDMAFWIEDIKKDLGVTVLMVEHDMSLVSRVSDRVLAMNQGEMLSLGTSKEVQSDPAVIEAYLGKQE